jgi:hypothetical protein
MKMKFCKRECTVKVFIKRINDWIPFETNEDNTKITYLFRGKEYTILWPKHQESGKLIEQSIDNILDVEMLEDDMKYYRATMKFKGRE